MKKITYIIVACLLIVACDNTNPLEDLGGEQAAFASWTTAPTGNLLTSDPSSSVSWEFELIDGNNGNDVTSVSIDISDGTNSGNLETVNSFSANEDGVQSASGSFNLNDIASTLGVGVGTIDEGDSFDFTVTVTKNDGSVWGQVNAGASSGYNPANPFSYSVAVETVSLVSISTIDTYLTSTNVDTIYLEFANDLTTQLAIDPVVTSISSGGDVIGPVQKIQDVDGVDSVYWVSYTPGPTTESISIVVSNASAYTSGGYVMTNDTTSALYFIDNTSPIVVENNSRLLRDGGLDTLGYSYSYIFNEILGSVSITEDVTGIDDDGDGDIDAADLDGDAITISVPPSDDLLFEYLYEWTGAADGEVTLTFTVTDRAGNASALGTVILTP